MKGRIKDRDLRNIRSKQVGARSDAAQVCRIVNWCQVDASFNTADDLVSDQDRAREFFAAVNHAMADYLNIVKMLDER